MELLRTFCTPIWITDLTLDISNLVSTIKSIQLKNPGRIVSNVGGWQSDDFVIDTTLEFEHLHNLTRIIQNSIDNISTQIDPVIRLSLDNLWLNINSHSNYNTPHYHSGSALSGVVYIKCVPGSNIEFIQDTNMIHYPLSTKSELFTDRFQLFPKEGRLIVFPSWLKHSVLPNETNDERISISFNIKQEIS